MALKIFSPGLDQYSAGGTARVKVLVIGGPGVGKTRWSSYFPEPFYADCEGGLASIADRGTLVRAARVSNSEDMLDVIKLMEQECRKPINERRFNTFIIDTVDAFQRKVKDEWLRKNPGADSFRGFDAWGYLDAKMQMLLTRLLNLDMNIIVAVHYEEKTVTEGSGDTAQQRQVIQLQLSGSIKDSIFNDFDLVGWMGTYYEAVQGQRVQKRGLTFQPTFEKPFLKDRLNVTPGWMEVTFSDEDYSQLFMAIASKLDDLPETQEFGEVPHVAENGATPADREGGLLSGGALPPVDPKSVPLEQHDKPTLINMAREMVKAGLITEPIKGNTIKSELIGLIRAAQEKQKAAAETPEQPQSDASAAAPATEAPAEPATADTASANTEPTPAESQPAPAQPASAPAESANAATESAPAASAPAPAESVIDTPDAGPVNPQTGEIKEPEAHPADSAPAQPDATHSEAVQAAQVGLGADVVSDRPVAEKSSTAATQPAAPARGPAPAAASGTCAEEGCEVPLADENQDLVKLSFIKFRKRYCNNHYQQHRNAG